MASNCETSVKENSKTESRYEVDVRAKNDPSSNRPMSPHSVVESTCNTSDLSSEMSSPRSIDMKWERPSKDFRTRCSGFAHNLGSNVAFAQIIASIISFIDYNVKAGAENWCDQFEFPVITDWRFLTDVEFETQKDCVTFSYDRSWYYDGLPAMVSPFLITVVFFISFAKPLWDLPFGTAAYVVAEINHRRSFFYKTSVSFCIFVCLVSFLAAVLLLRSKSGAIPVELYYHGFLILLAFRQLLLGSFRRPLDLTPASLERLLLIRVKYGMFEHPENMLDRIEHALLRYGAFALKAGIQINGGEIDAELGWSPSSPSKELNRLITAMSDIVDMPLSACTLPGADAQDHPSLFSVSAFAYSSILAVFTSDYEESGQATEGVGVISATLSYWFSFLSFFFEKH